jgi:hypothetical protein
MGRRVVQLSRRAGWFDDALCGGEDRRTSRRRLAPVTGRPPNTHHGRDHRCARTDPLEMPTRTRGSFVRKGGEHHETSKRAGG